MMLPFSSASVAAAGIPSRQPWAGVCSAATRFAHKLGDGADDQRDVGDTTAAGGDRDRRARLQSLAQTDALEFGEHGTGDIIDPIARQRLAHPEEPWQRQHRVVSHQWQCTTGPALGGAPAPDAARGGRLCSPSAQLASIALNATSSKLRLAAEWRAVALRHPRVGGAGYRLTGASRAPAPTRPVCTLCETCRRGS